MIPKTDLYKDTEATVEKSKTEINAVLAKFGITKKRWTEAGAENTFLEFILETESVPIKIKITLPFIETMRKTAEGIIPVYDEPRAFRFFFHYLKALLAVKDVGILSVEEIFMGHIVIPLPGGEETTMGEQLHKVVQSGSMPALEGFTIVQDKTPKLVKLET